GEVHVRRGVVRPDVGRRHDVALAGAPNRVVHRRRERERGAGSDVALVLDRPFAVRGAVIDHLGEVAAAAPPDSATPATARTAPPPPRPPPRPPPAPGFPPFPGLLPVPPPRAPPIDTRLTIESERICIITFDLRGLQWTFAVLTAVYWWQSMRTHTLGATSCA